MSMGGGTGEGIVGGRMRRSSTGAEVAAHMAANEETLFYDLLTVLHR
jgi:hypothetical protein